MTARSPAGVYHLKVSLGFFGLLIFDYLVLCCGQAPVEGDVGGGRVGRPQCGDLGQKCPRVLTARRDRALRLSVALVKHVILRISLLNCRNRG
jgi:hypothetical protein